MKQDLLYQYVLLMPILSTIPEINPGLLQQQVNESNLVKIQQLKWNLPTVMNTNICGALASKLNEISCVAKQNSVEVICLTETWCTSLIPDSAICLEGYNISRRDRKDGRLHGGIICYIKDNIPTYCYPELDIQELDTLWITLRQNKMPRQYIHITLGIIYHPPGSDDRRMCSHIIESLGHIRQKHP